VVILTFHAEEFHAEESAVSMKVNCDVQLTLMANNLYRLFGARIGNGYTSAMSRHLFRDFVDATATVTLTGNEVLVRFQKRARNPPLIAAGFGDTPLSIPWLQGKHLRLVFEQGRGTWC